MRQSSKQGKFAAWQHARVLKTKPVPLLWSLLTFLDQVCKPLSCRHTAVVIKDVKFSNANGLMVLYPFPQILILVLHAQAHRKVGLSRIPHQPLCRGFWGQGLFTHQEVWVTCKAHNFIIAFTHFHCILNGDDREAYEHHIIACLPGDVRLAGMPTYHPESAAVWQLHSEVHQ